MGIKKAGRFAVIERVPARNRAQAGAAAHRLSHGQAKRLGASTALAVGVTSVPLRLGRKRGRRGSRTSRDEKSDLLRGGAGHRDNRPLQLVRTTP